METYDVIIIGAGAAGLMCATQAASRSRRVLILEKSNKVGKKILMSGGGRCNFTNLYTTPEQFISHNKHFCKSALSRYTPKDFITLVEKHRIAYFEKTAGQLFCEDKSSQIVEMFLKECAAGAVSIELNQAIQSVKKMQNHFIIHTHQQKYQCEHVVVATGGLSIPTLGSSPYGYQLAAEFGLAVYPTRAGLVPFTLHIEDKRRLESLAGISIEAAINCRGVTFKENMLFTHRGLSGPAILQISSYWQPGDLLEIRLLPQLDLHVLLLDAQKTSPESSLKTLLAQHMAKRIVSAFYDEPILNRPIKQLDHHHLLAIAKTIQPWKIFPNATEGYRTAEVTLGGVDCNEVSSQTFEARKVPGLFFVGEVLDVTGWLGGYNFQWAWASGWAAGQVV